MKLNEAVQESIKKSKELKKINKLIFKYLTDLISTLGIPYESDGEGYKISFEDEHSKVYINSSDIRTFLEVYAYIKDDNLLVMFTAGKLFGSNWHTVTKIVTLGSKEEIPIQMLINMYVNYFNNNIVDIITLNFGDFWEKETL